MEATAFYSSTTLPFQPFSGTKSPLARHRRSASKVFAMGRGRLVDESMIVLRKRIHETKMIERNYEPPSEWMDWEKQYYTSYDSDICEAMGLLQSLLMNLRPSVALGLVALVMLSVPTSTVLIMFHLIEMAKWLIH